MDSAPHQHVFCIWWAYTSPGGWTQYRRLSTCNPAWFQRFVEAWWVLIGRWSLERAYNAGLARARRMRPLSKEDFEGLVNGDAND